MIARFSTFTALALALSLGDARGSSTTLFALVDTGELFVSTDQGSSWTVHAILPVHDAVALAASSSNTELFLATRSGGVYRSDDGGAGWSVVGAVPTSDVADLLIRADLSLLLLTTSGGVFRSTDRGASFTVVGVLTGSRFMSLAQTLPDQKLYALTGTGEVFESVDGGASWEPKGAFAVSDAIALQGVGLTLFALGETGFIHRSTDGGTTWMPVGTLSQSGMAALAQDGGTLLASTRGGETAISNDGSSWTWRGVINQLTVTALGTDTPATTGVAEPPPTSLLGLTPPWPNPVRRGAPVQVAFRLEEPATVTLALYDVAGRRAVTWPPREYPAGPNVFRLSPPPDQAGLYFLVLNTGSGAARSAPLVVLK